MKPRLAVSLLIITKDFGKYKQLWRITKHIKAVTYLVIYGQLEKLRSLQSVMKSEQVTCGTPGLFLPADILVNENNALTEKTLSTVPPVFGNFSQILEI